MKFDDIMVHATFSSPLGTVLIAATDKGLAGLWFEGQRHLPAELTGSRVWPKDPTHPLLEQTAAQISEYFAGHRLRFDLALDLERGTVFQRSVWQALQAIPPGKTVSYGEISAKMGKPAAVRAVGAAIGRNPISIIVPCHRVVGAGRALTGYAGGLERKKALLELEGALLENP